MRELHSIRLFTLAALLLATLGLGLGGCATGVKVGNAAATHNSTADLRTDLATARTQLQELSATLLETDRPQDLNSTRWFKRFRKQHKAARSAAINLREQSQQYDLNRRAYLDQWEADLNRITQPDLRDSSAQRRDKVRTQLRTVGDGLEKIHQDFQPLLSNLGDLETFFANDLTPTAFTQGRDRLTAAWETTNQITDQSSTLLDAMNKLVDNLKPTQR